MTGEPLFIDTSGWLALANAKEPAHPAVHAALAAATVRPVTTTYVFDEIVTLGQRRLGHAAAVEIGDRLRDEEAVDLVRPPAADEEAAWRLFCARPDKGYSFTDCVSFVVMERLALEVAVTTDAEFGREGFVTVPG